MEKVGNTWFVFQRLEINVWWGTESAFIRLGLATRVAVAWRLHTWWPLALSCHQIKGHCPRDWHWCEDAPLALNTSLEVWWKQPYFSYICTCIGMIGNENSCWNGKYVCLSICFSWCQYIAYSALTTRYTACLLSQCKVLSWGMSGLDSFCWQDVVCSGC